MPAVFKYCNGDKGFISPVRITSATPSETTGSATPGGGATQTGVIKHGAMLNPGIGGHADQGFTNVVPLAGGLYVGYDAAKKITLPYTFTAGQSGSIVKSMFQETLVGSCFPALKALSVLTVVSSAPPAGAFRPPVASTDKTSYFTESMMMDLTTLPNYAAVSGGPNIDAVIAALRHWQPVVWTHGDPARYLAATYNNPFGTYPVRDVGPIVAWAIIMLCQNYTLAQKRDLAVSICQIGIDVLAFLQGRTFGFDYGGISGSSGLGGVVQRGYKLALGAAGIIFNNATMKEWADSALHPNFGEDGDLRYIDAADVAQDQAAIPLWRPGRTNYTADDLGGPEWTEDNQYIYPTMGDRSSGATYRSITGPYFVVHALAAHILPGLRAVLNQQVILDYADRVMERNFVKNPADPLNVYRWMRTLSGTNSMTPWEIACWDATRTAAGMPPVWNW